MVCLRLNYSVNSKAPRFTSVFAIVCCSAANKEKLHDAVVPMKGENCKMNCSKSSTEL